MAGAKREANSQTPGGTTTAEGDNSGGGDGNTGGNVAGGANMAAVTTELNLLKSKTKKMELEIKLLRRKLAKAGVEGGEQQTVEELIEEAKQEVGSSGGQTSGDGEEKKTSAGGAETGDIMATSLDENMAKELNEFEVKEIDVLKYKHEQDIIAIKKEYGDQLDFINNRVS